MKHIGEAIREERRKKKLSAAEVGRKLSKPITGQAFAQKEVSGNFLWEIVLEVSLILNVEPQIFLIYRKV